MIWCRFTFSLVHSKSAKHFVHESFVLGVSYNRYKTGAGSRTFFLTLFQSNTADADGAGATPCVGLADTFGGVGPGLPWLSSVKMSTRAASTIKEEIKTLINRAVAVKRIFLFTA